jgi:ankyrin repeat protein
VDFEAIVRTELPSSHEMKTALSSILEDEFGVDWAAVNFLVEHGANVNQILSGGSTLLITAITKMPRWVSRLLRDCKANPNVTDLQGRTPLNRAVARAADAEVCLLLLRYGATPEPKLLPDFLKLDSRGRLVRRMLTLLSSETSCWECGTRVPELVLLLICAMSII